MSSVKRIFFIFANFEDVNPKFSHRRLSLCKQIHSCQHFTVDKNSACIQWPASTPLIDPIRRKEKVNDLKKILRAVKPEAIITAVHLKP